MTISRASMRKQLKGNKVKKKKVKKMIGGGDLLGSISPLAGAISGKGMFGRALGKGLKNVSPLGALLSKMGSKGKASPISPVEEKKEKKNPMGDPGEFAPAALAVKAGGSLKKKRRIDGIAQRGKTRAVR